MLQVRRRGLLEHLELGLTQDAVYPSPQGYPTKDTIGPNAPLAPGGPVPRSALTLQTSETYLPAGNSDSIYGLRAQVTAQGAIVTRSYFESPSIPPVLIGQLASDCHAGDTSYSVTLTVDPSTIPSGTKVSLDIGNGGALEEADTEVTSGALTGSGPYTVNLASALSNDHDQGALFYLSGTVSYCFQFASDVTPTYPALAVDVNYCDLGNLNPYYKGGGGNQSIDGQVGVRFQNSLIAYNGDGVKLSRYTWFSHCQIGPTLAPAQDPAYHADIAQTVNGVNNDQTATTTLDFSNATYGTSGADTLAVFGSTWSVFHNCKMVGLRITPSGSVNHTHAVWFLPSGNSGQQISRQVIVDSTYMLGGTNGMFLDSSAGKNVPGVEGCIIRRSAVHFAPSQASTNNGTLAPDVSSAGSVSGAIVYTYTDSNGNAPYWQEVSPGFDYSTADSNMNYWELSTIADIGATLTSAASGGSTMLHSNISYPSGTKLGIVDPNTGSVTDIVTTTGAPTGSGPYNLPISALSQSYATGSLLGKILTLADATRGVKSW